ncbi:uncharacterized protein V6R79_015197 [Siganus canaliculatus]
MDEVNSIQTTSTMHTEELEKPWRKSGADITDYFNYGFNEETWKKYCKKQSKLAAANRKLHGKTLVQRWRSRHEEKEEYRYHCSSDRPSVPYSRLVTHLLLTLSPYCSTLFSIACCAGRAQSTDRLAAGCYCLWHNNYQAAAICFL